MKREIRFRGWHKSTSKMIDLKEITPMALSDGILDEGDGLFIPFRDDLILMQFTGLKDKNGIDIFEGDVIEYPLGKQGCNGVRNGIIEFIEDSFCIKWTNRFAKGIHSLIGQYPEIIIIGNIHQHPELL